MNINEVEDLEVEGVDPSDYPDFCDAYFSRGFHIKENRELTPEELEELREKYPDILWDKAYMSLID